MARWSLLLGALGWTACTRSPPPAPPPAPQAQAPVTSRQGKVRLVPAPAYPDAAVLVVDLAAQAAQQGRRLLVYVGAPWCEPCRYLHDAAEHGGLDDRVGPVDLLMFDSEGDSVRLQQAGYSSKYIPLLAVPGPDGRASGLQMEGGIKGPGAVENLVPRLLTMLDQAK